MLLVYAERAEVGIMGPRFEARDLDEASVKNSQAFDRL